jgi:hypothetical protein
MPGRGENESVIILSHFVNPTIFNFFEKEIWEAVRHTM